MKDIKKRSGQSRLSYELDDTKFDSRQRQENGEAGSRAYLTSYSTGTCILPPEAEGPKCEAYNSSPSSAEVQNQWSYTSSPTACLHGVSSDNFTFNQILN
jgi:hypothetical protein